MKHHFEGMKIMKKFVVGFALAMGAMAVQANIPAIYFGQNATNPAEYYLYTDEGRTSHYTEQSGLWSVTWNVDEGMPQLNLNDGFVCHGVLRICATSVVAVNGNVLCDNGLVVDDGYSIAYAGDGKLTKGSPEEVVLYCKEQSKPWAETLYFARANGAGYALYIDSDCKFRYTDGKGTTWSVSDAPHLGQLYATLTLMGDLEHEVVFKQNAADPYVMALKVSGGEAAMWSLDASEGVLTIIGDTADAALTVNGDLRGQSIFLSQGDGMTVNVDGSIKAADDESTTAELVIGGAAAHMTLNLYNGGIYFANGTVSFVNSEAWLCFAMNAHRTSVGIKAHKVNLQSSTLDVSGYDVGIDMHDPLAHDDDGAIVNLDQGSMLSVMANYRGIQGTCAEGGYYYNNVTIQDVDSEIDVYGEYEAVSSAAIAPIPSAEGYALRSMDELGSDVTFTIGTAPNYPTYYYHTGTTAPAQWLVAKRGQLVELQVPAVEGTAAAVVYADGAAVAPSGDKWYVYTNETVNVTYTVTDDDYTFADGRTSCTISGIDAESAPTLVPASQVPAAPVLAWSTNAVVRFDVSFTTNAEGVATFLATGPGDVLPLAYTTNWWGEMTSPFEASGMHVNYSVRSPNWNNTNVIQGGSRCGHPEWRLGDVLDWTPPAGAYGYYDMHHSLHDESVQDGWRRIYGTILYTTNFNLTVTQPEGGTIAAYTNGAAAVDDCWPLAQVDEVTLSASPAGELWTFERLMTNGTEVLDESFVMPFGAVSVTAEFRYLGVELQPAEIANTELKFYTNGVEVVATGDKYIVLTNTPAEVVCTAKDDYLFEGGLKVVTNKLDTTKNPATVVGELPVVLEPIEYCEPIYVGGVASNGIERWETKACWNYTVVTSEAETVTWGDRESTNWYAVVDADVELGGAAECFGHVKLILCKGAKLSVTNNEHESGIWTDVEGSFTVYGQPDGAGELIAAGSGQSAGIGGDGDDGRNITINGGTITATGGRYGGAGIGGGTARDGNGLVVNGGTVTAIGRRGGTGIGGGAAGGGLKGAFMDKRRTRGVGSEITINGGTVTAIGSCGAAAIGGGSGEGGVDMPGLLTFMPAGGAPGVDIAINGGTLYLASPITDNRGEIQCGELIGGGYSSEIASSGIHVSDQAKVFFNLTGCVNHRDEEVASVAAMPTDFAGFVAMTPATQTVDRVLVGGCGGQGLPALPAAFVLTNAATAATDTIAVNAERHLPFASTFLRLTYADEKLTLKIDSPELTISQQPEVANGYTIIAETDGNEGITNYAWGVKTERSLGFVALTNENLLCWMYDCHVEDDSVVSDGGYMGYCLDLGWYASKLPRNGRFRFSCPVLLTLEDRSQGTLTRDGEEYVFTPAVSDDNIGFYVTAEETIVVSGLVYEYVEFDVKAEGENLTAFPPEVGEENSNYVCRVTYGHNGTFHVGESEEFTYGGPLDVSLAFDAMGGMWNDVTSVTNVETGISDGYVLPGDPARTDYAFIGWYDGWTNGAPVVTNGQPLLRAAAHTLYAKWESMKIEPGAGEESIGAETVPGGSAIITGPKSAGSAPADLVLPEMTSNGPDGKPFTVVQSNAFLKLQSIRSVAMPLYVTNVRERAFLNCRNVESLTFVVPRDYGTLEKKPLAIGAYAYAGLGIGDLVIPSDVVAVGEYAFAGCPYLTNVVIKGTFERKGLYPFNNCAYYRREAGVTIHLAPAAATNAAFVAWLTNGCAKVKIAQALDGEITATAIDMTTEPGFALVSFTYTGSGIVNETTLSALYQSYDNPAECCVLTPIAVTPGAEAGSYTAKFAPSGTGFIRICIDEYL